MKRRRWLQLMPLAGGGLAAAKLTRAATPGVELPPVPGAQRPLVVPAIAEMRLANGVRLLVVPRPGVPLVTASLHVRAGREHDPLTLPGLAAMTAQLLTKGARRGGRDVNATALARQAEALGGALDVGSGWRSANLAMTVTTPKLPAALALMSDVLRSPLLRGDELERLRMQTLDVLKLTLANPGDVSGLASRRWFWGASVYGGSATPASLQRLTLAAARAHHTAYFQPERALLVLAGDVDASQGQRWAEAALGAWRAAPAVAAAPGGVGVAGTAAGAAASIAVSAQARNPAGNPANASAATRQALVHMPGSGQSGVVVAAPFAALADADRRVAEVAAALLGGGYSSRLNLEVRIKRGLSYDARGGGESHAEGGMFSASAQTQHATAREVAALMREQILRLAREEPPAEELAARKASLVGGFARQLETTAGLAAQVASQHFQGRPLAELARYADEVMAVTPAQVRAFAERHWVAERLSTVIAGDVPPMDGEWPVAITALDLEWPQLKKP